MAKTPIPIAQGFYVSDSLPIAAQRCVNWRPNVPQSSTITDVNLFGTEGLLELARTSNLAGIDGRGIHVMNGVPYFVIGQSLFRLNLIIDAGDQSESFTTDNVGAVPGVDPVSMADNGTQLCIVARPDSVTSGESFIFVEPATFTKITDAAFDGPAVAVTYIDGFFNFIKADGKKFFNSALQDGLTYDALDFSRAFADPDDIKAQGVLRNQLYILGSNTIQPFRNIGRSPAPFQGITGAVIDVGISAPDSLQKFGAALVFVGSSEDGNESPGIWRVTGNQKQKLSTIAIDNVLSGLSDSELTGITSWVYSESGSFMYGLTLPDTCFVYDGANGRWHERLSKIEEKETAFRVGQMAYAYNRVLVNDRADAVIGELKRDLYTEYDNLIRRFVTSKAFDNLGNAFFIASIEAMIEAGVGLTNDIELKNGTTSLGVPITVVGGADPMITLSWSNDGARTFKGFRSKPMGKIGKYKTRAIWYRLGRFTRSIVLQLEFSSPTKATLIKMEADVG
jgi:hypothetical protein